MNNDINIIPFYGSVQEQNHRKLHTYGDVFNLISPSNSFIPFQFARTHRDGTTISANLYDLKDSLVCDITEKLSIVVDLGDEYDMLINYGNDFSDKLDAGVYYIEISDGVETWYSEVFTVVPDLSNYLKVEYWDNSDIIMDGWKILYSDGFKFRLYLQSGIGKPEYKFEEEVEKRDNNSFYEKQISSKTFRFSFLAPEYLCDAIRVIRLHDNVTIKEGDKVYDASTFTVSPKWDSRGDIAQVLAEFETDTNIKKIAKSPTWKAPRVFRGALLANMNDPVLFAQSSIVLFTEKYQEDLQGTAFIGKLIRQLEIEVEVTDRMEIAVDKGVGDAKKMNLVDAVKSVVEIKDFKTKGKFEFEKLIKVEEGIDTSDFATGLTGRGFQIKKDENGKWHEEIDSLTVREFLEVPELRFNRVDVVSGELWNATAFGTIESVDTENQIVTVKLLDGELLTSHINDICRGVFYNIGTGSGELVDNNGFVQMQGFGTAYFTPVELLPDGKSFRYTLQSGTAIHPCKAMKYVSYGNFTDKSRQASKYSTRTYTRYLRHVNTWNIIPDKNIVAQFGDLEGLTIGGVTMHGNGSYLNNIYMTGVSIQFTPEQLEDMKGNDAYSVCLSSPSATIKKKANDIVSYQEEMNVVSGESNVVSGAFDIVASSHLLRTQIQAHKGTKPMFYSDVMQPCGYTIETYPVNCECTIDGGVLLVTTISDLSKERAYVDMDVNCEGNAVISLRYSITIVEDGVDGNDGIDGKGIEFIFRRQSEITTPSKPDSKNVDDFIPDGWTDDQQGVTSTYQYEFVSKRVKSGATWGNYSTPALWAKYSFNGEDGADGKDGADYEFIFTRTTSNNHPDTPKTSQADDYIPNGWTDNAIGVTSTYQYEWTSKRSKIEGIWGNYSTPALWAKYAFDGSDGESAVSYNFISPVTSIRKNALGFFEPSSFGVTLKKSVGSVIYDCSDKYLTVFGSEGGNHWVRVTNSVVNSSVMVVPQANYNMYSVIATDGYNPSFTNSAYAMIGINVIDGQMAGSFPRNCGEYKSISTYIYDADFRDCVYVKDGIITRVFMVKHFGHRLTDVHPLVGSIISDEWTEGNVEQFTAINTAIIDGGDIGGMLFKDGKMISRSGNIDGKPSTDTKNLNYTPNLTIDGNTGVIDAFSGTFHGSVKTDFGDIEEVTEYDTTIDGYLIKDVLNVSCSGIHDVVLPSDIKYAGSIINIVDTNFPPWTKTSMMYYTLIQTHPKSMMRGIGIGGSCDTLINERFTDPHLFRIRGCLVQLLGVPLSGMTYWIILNYKNNMEAIESTKTASTESQYLDIGRPLTCQKVDGKNTGAVMQERQPQIRDKIVVVHYMGGYTWYSDWRNNGNITQVIVRYDTTTCPL